MITSQNRVNDLANFLETERLNLRKFRDDDLETLLAYRNDPDVYIYQGWKVPFTREAAVEFIAEMSKREVGTQDTSFQIVLALKTTDELIGDLGYFPNKHDPRQIRVGYTLAKKYWGNGYATEAMRALLDYAFDVQHAHRVIADLDPRNAASLKLLERLGFRREAHFVENYWMGDYWADEYLYAILEREWRERRQAH